MESTDEVVRVTQRGGIISMYLVNRMAAAIERFRDDPKSALDMLSLPPGHLEEYGERHWFVTPGEVAAFFAAKGVRVLHLYAVCGWLDVLGISQTIAESRSWDEQLFNQTTQVVLGLTMEPSVRGLSRHLLLYGEKT
jgi:hypothetical protein